MIQTPTEKTNQNLSPFREIFDFSDLADEDDFSSYRSDNEWLVSLAIEKFERRKKGDPLGQVRNLIRFGGRTYGRSIYTRARLDSSI